MRKIIAILFLYVFLIPVPSMTVFCAVQSETAFDSIPADEADTAAPLSEYLQNDNINQAAPVTNFEQTGAAGQAAPVTDFEQTGAAGQTAPVTDLEQTGAAGQAAPITDLEQTGAADQAAPIPDFGLTSAEAGTDAVLVIDVSGSMIHTDPDYYCRQAALDFLGSLSDEGTLRASLITFSDSLESVTPLSEFDPEDPENELARRISELTYTKGDTDIGLAMEKATQILKEADLDGRSKCILLLTDGEIDLPAAPDEEAAEKESQTRALMAVEDAKSENIVIHTVALDLSEDQDRNLLDYMARSTGGTYNKVDQASMLEQIFVQLSEQAKAQARAAREARERALMEAMAETETEPEPETESETETETESETEPLPTVIVKGSPDGPVRLKGILPDMCTGEIDLSELFSLDLAGVSSSDSIFYTAYSDNNDLVSCSIKDGLLTLSGQKNGKCTIYIYAEPASPVPSDPASVSPEDQAQLTFTVEVDALLPSVLYLILPAGILAAFLMLGGLVFFHFRANRYALGGELSWYVKGEHEKVFGMPTQSSVDLSEYGRNARLDELVQDELTNGGRLDKVILSGHADGICIKSRSSSCLIAAPGRQPSNKLVLSDSGRFRILFETENGKAAVIASYTAPYYGDEFEDYNEPYEGQNEDQTRMLI